MMLSEFVDCLLDSPLTHTQTGCSHNHRNWTHHTQPITHISTKMNMMKKTFVVTFSNTALLALCFAGLVQAWDQQAFELFLATRLKQVLQLSLAYLAFLIIMPMFPRPKKVVLNDATKPSLSQARTMAVVTAIMDYAVVGGLFIFWGSTCRLSNGGLCPFSAAATVVAALAVMPAKDEIQCRVMWRKFISPFKLNSWHYSWRYLFGQLHAILFGAMTLLTLCLSGLVTFESFTEPKVLLRIWAEAFASEFIFTDLVAHIAHKWLHKQAYFLHKKHHKGKADVMCLHAIDLDLFDVFVEFGSGIAVLILFKWLLGFSPRIHLLSHNLAMIMAYQIHSGNPYAAALFNPVLDCMCRPSVCHNLHHVLQKDYYGAFPFGHVVSGANRRKDTALYNKHMRTNFPC